MSITIKIVSLILGSILIMIDVLFILKKRKNYKRTDLKVFLLEDFFFIGDEISKLLKISTGKRIRKLEEIYDLEKAGQVAKSARAAPFTYLFLFLPIALFTFALTGNSKALFLMLFMILFMMVYFDIWLDGCLKKRHEEILREFATVLSKMSLLLNAGLTANDALRKVAISNEGLLYDELRKLHSELDLGRNYDEALEALCTRCGCKEIKKFVSLYKQNMKKGGPEFSVLLSNMAEDAWEERKNRAKIAGTAAEQKLLIPIMMMFVGVLIMVIVPAFNSLL